MREIKFRAWDKRQKEIGMIDVIEVIAKVSVIMVIATGVVIAAISIVPYLKYGVGLLK
mgnify:FL=1|tara:strand:- start:491 stop:664 length:174 start_codon:yes stop_codon:yes gene_type:complete